MKSYSIEFREKIVKAYFQGNTSIRKVAARFSVAKSMDNVPADKVKEIEPLIQSVGASVLYQSPYSPDFNPIKHWWSQLKAFLRLFSPTTPKMVDVLIATALDLMNPKHFKKWFTHSCYCTS